MARRRRGVASVGVGCVPKTCLRARGLALGVLVAASVACLVATPASGQPSQAGGAGHALLFSNNVATIAPFNDMPTDELTFEAWVETSDSCHTGAIVSYAEQAPQTSDSMARVRAFNSFVVWNIKDLLACRDYELLDRIPDPQKVSCRSAFTTTKSKRNPINLADGEWHHVAVTWSARNKGLTTIYVDGMKRAQAETGKTNPIKPGGALVLGAEQDCYGGCFEKDQAYYGYMDEVRIWSKALTQTEILKNMRFSGTYASGLAPDGLVAYWKFDDPKDDHGILTSHYTARDYSGRGNVLNVVTKPKQADRNVEFGGRDLGFPALELDNNYAMQSWFQGMPDKDITIEFWAKTPAISDSSDDRIKNQEILSFASDTVGNGDVDDDGGYADAGFIDDAILIEKYATEFKGTSYLDKARDVSTVGSISVHVNANRQGNNYKFDNWIDFPVNWKDDKWHHIAVTWRQSDGRTELYFDGKSRTPFWSSEGHRLDNKSPNAGGVKPNMSPNTKRSNTGSLVLGQNQECFGGCFSPHMAYHGSIADLRIWDHVVGASDISRRMTQRLSGSESGLAAHYEFNVYGEGVENAVDTRYGGSIIPRSVNRLKLGGAGPTWHYSYAPLETADGHPVERPKPGGAGHALQLDDKQVLMLEDFKDFPETEATLEFWMWSVDTCREGVPFSYATGDEYATNDNSFLLFNYNSWGVGIMEDEGTIKDHLAGVAATDGKWHHIAVTWESSTGRTVLYDNGRKIWTVRRGKGKRVPSGGTLVVGREQDCLGGCFDSGKGAKGDTQTDSKLEYGAEDFFGMVEEMRLWRRVRTQAEIIQGMQSDDGRSREHGYDNPGVDANHPDLVAYWRFNEGDGFVVKDATGRGHDLKMTFEPKWRVINWLSICGNGVVEGAEQCDDGNTRNGDGCDHRCMMEPGWWCTGESPSLCSRKDQHRRYTPVAPPPYSPSSSSSSSPSSSSGSPRDVPMPYDPSASGGDGSSGGSGGSKKKHGHGGIIFFVFFVLVCAGLGGFAYVRRYEIYDRFPKVKQAMDYVADKIGRARRRDEYGMLQLDGDDKDFLSPDFVGMQPSPGAYRPPQDVPTQNENDDAAQ